MTCPQSTYQPLSEFPNPGSLTGGAEVLQVFLDFMLGRGGQAGDVVERPEVLPVESDAIPYGPVEKDPVIGLIYGRWGSAMASSGFQARSRAARLLS
jgi:hypothetical protein